MKAKTKQLLLLMILLNAISITTTQADEDVDAEFLEFLADMEESTGSGFDQWLEDTSVDSTKTNTETDEQSIQK